MHFFFIAFFSFLLSMSDALAQEDKNESFPLQASEQIQAKQLYQSFYELPKKLFKGQVFTLTIKALSTNADYESLSYDFSNAEGIMLISEEKEHALVSPYFYDTFYFQVTGNRVRIPDVTTSVILNSNSDEALSETIRGHVIETIRLNPEDDFCQVLADEFKVLEYKTKQYDNQHNIVVFSAEAKMANLNDFSLHSASKEGIDEHEENFPYSNFTYYAVVSKQLNELKFVYFDLNTHRFQDVIIPIIVSNDKVSTQTDLAPTQNSHTLQKIMAAATLSAVGLVLFIYRRKKFYFIVFILPLFFVAKLSIPTEYVCITEGSNLYLLPLQNGTIFEQVPLRFTTESLGKTEDFTKIRMQNKQIGWVKNENICSN